DGLGNLEQNEGADGGDAPGECDGGELVHDLDGISVDRAAVTGIDPGDGEDAGEDRPDGSADAVDAESVERVVVAEDVLHGGGAEETGRAGDKADQKTRHGGDKAAGRRN